MKRRVLVWLLTLYMVAIYIVAMFALAQDTSTEETQTQKTETQRLVQGSLYQDSSQPTQARVADLLSQMTLSEKVGQMTQIDVSRLMGQDPWDRGPLNEDWVRTVFEDHQVGSLLSGGGVAPETNTPEAWAQLSNELQEAALEYSRLGIPYIHGVDAVHGHNNVLGATIYPHNLGLGATMNPELVEQVAAKTAQDVRATGQHWSFAPVADIARDARWGRFYESFGEDPLLASELVAASVRGFEASGNVASTVKHFAGYGQPLMGFDRSPAFLDPRTLNAVQLPSFAAAIDAGAQTMMVNSGSVNGVPVHASPYMLQEVAREQLGFEGVMLSDWEDITKLVTVHQVAADFKDAVAMSINAGVDMSMVPHDVAAFTDALIELVEEGTVPETRIDDAVSRILTLKFELGLFENPYTEVEAVSEVVLEDERTLAKQAAAESLTLLKNGPLPFDNTVENILVVGPSADSIENQTGGWTIGWQGVSDPSEVPPGLSVLEALQKSAPEGVSINALSNYQDAETLDDAASEADVAIVVVGETPYAEGEGNSAALDFPEEQLELMRTLTKTDILVVAVLIAGRPLIIPQDIQRGLDSLIMAYLPGSEGGTAIADVLYGEANPSGKLPFSWPASSGQIPITYDVMPGTPYEPLYAFGHGLSYTTFAQENLDVTLDGDTLNITLDIENTGEVAGSESIHVYLKRPPLGVLTPMKQLLGFAKVSLEPGEVQTLNIAIPTERFAVISGDVFDAEPVVLPGSYTLEVGGAQAEVEIAGD